MSTGATLGGSVAALGRRRTASSTCSATAAEADLAVAEAEIGTQPQPLTIDETLDHGPSLLERIAALEDEMAELRLEVAQLRARAGRPVASGSLGGPTRVAVARIPAVVARPGARGRRSMSRPRSSRPR